MFKWCAGTWDSQWFPHPGLHLKAFATINIDLVFLKIQFYLCVCVYVCVTCTQISTEVRRQQLDSLELQLEALGTKAVHSGRAGSAFNPITIHPIVAADLGLQLILCSLALYLESLLSWQDPHTLSGQAREISPSQGHRDGSLVPSFAMW